MALKEIIAAFGIDLDTSPLDQGGKKVESTEQKFDKLADALNNLVTHLNELLKVFGVDIDTKKVDEGTKNVEEDAKKLSGATDKAKSKALSLKEALTTVGQAFVGTKVVQFLSGMVNELQATAEQTSKTARDLRVGTQDLQALGYAAGKARVETSDLYSAMDALREKMRLSARVGIYNVDAFRRFGIAAKDTKGNLRSTADVLPEIADKIKGTRGELRQAALAQRFFGDAGKKILPLLKQGSAGFKAAREEIEKLGGGMSDRTIEELKELTDAQQRFGMASTGLKNQIVSALLPLLTALVNKVAFATGKFVAWVKPVAEMVRNSNALQAALLLLTGGALMKFLRLLGGVSGILKLLGRQFLIFALPVLLIDELITTFQGGDTIIRRVLKKIGAAIDEAFGDGTSQAIADWFKDAFSWVQWFFGLFTGTAESALAKIAALWDMLEWAVGSVFFELSAVAGEVTASIGDFFEAMWQRIVEGAQVAITKAKELLDFIPGVTTLADKLSGFLGSTVDAAAGSHAAMAAQENDRARVARLGQYESINRRLQNGVSVVNNNTTNVTVPPGTSSAVANAVGQKAAAGAKRGAQATRAALVQRAG